MNIRIAERKDLEAIVEIYNQAISAGQKTADLTPFTTDDRKQWFEGHTPDKYPIIVAEEKEQVVGYLTIGEYRSGRNALRHTAEVSFFIHFEYHRQGLMKRQKMVIPGRSILLIIRNNNILLFFI